MRLHWLKRDGKVAIDYDRVDQEILEYDFQIENAYRISKNYPGFGKGFHLKSGYSRLREAIGNSWKSRDLF